MGKTFLKIFRGNNNFLKFQEAMNALSNASKNIKQSIIYLLYNLSIKKIFKNPDS